MTLVWVCYGLKKGDGTFKIRCNKGTQRGTIHARGIAKEWEGYNEDINIAKELCYELKSGNAEADVILNEIVIWQPEDRFELEATEQNLVRLAEEHNRNRRSYNHARRSRLV